MAKINLFGNFGQESDADEFKLKPSFLGSKYGMEEETSAGTSLIIGGRKVIVQVRPLQDITYKTPKPKKQKFRPSPRVRGEKLSASVFSSLPKGLALDEAPIEAMMPNPKKLSPNEQKTLVSLLEKLKSKMIFWVGSLYYVDGGYDDFYADARMNADEINMFAASMNHHRIRFTKPS